MGSGWGSGDEECSVIGDKGEIGFIDYEDDKSVCSYNPIDEGPVVVSVPFPFVGGKPQSVLVGETAKDCVTIKNTTSEPIDLWTVKIYCSNPEDSYSLSLMEPPSADATVEEIQGYMESFTLEDRVLQPRRTLTVWVSCKPKDIGLHTTVVHFDAGDDRIERVVFLLAEDRISQSLVSKRPYRRAERRNRQTVTEYVAGTRPTKPGGTHFKKSLPQYHIPKDIRESLETKEVPHVVVEGLNRENYGAFFSTLLIMEELKLEEEMKGHDMESVPMRKKGHFLALEVPGLAERRPSLVIGDYVFATQASTAEDIRPYQGYIHRVEADEVFLRFAKDLHLIHQDATLYNIRFGYNRTNMRRLYQAIQAAGKLDNELLFPSDTSERTIEAPPVVPLTPSVNMEQMSSVEKILGCKGAPPYVIHGPPGTGKTLTVVEAILQLYKNRKGSRILVCASSNSAADHIIDNLISKEHVKIQDCEIFRLNAMSRPYEDVRTEHTVFCYFEDYVFKCPPLKALMRYRIIISTYMSTSLLYGEGIKRGHFSHIFLDEAGQSSEPETMIPISSLCRKETVVVLAGDPMQLGPVIYSKEAETYGLGKSYLERLFECDFYHNENENYVTKLVRNYRCHPAILELPSELFYKGELIAAKEEKTPAGAWESLLPNKDFPVLFIGIQGCDEREGNNPSWFNRIEISKVVEIIRKLRNNDDLSDSDIGVITPYRQQVLKLRKILDEQLEMPDVKVGSVEQFQGQEREVIIISTVRSTVKHNEFDKLHYLGFLSNPRRFNVATTRARSLLIIIGNPHIIAKDPFWDKLLRYCADNNSYKGCSLPEPQEFTEEDFNITQKVYYAHQNSQPTNNGEWGENNNGEWGNDHENFQPNDGKGWGDDSSNAVETGKPITKDAEWGESNNGDWCSGRENTQPKGWGESNNGDWCSGHENTQPTGWGDESFNSVETAKPVTNDAGWGDESFNSVETAKPVTNDAGWGDSNSGDWCSGYKDIQPTGWDDESFNAVETVKPVVDDAEPSHGWKSDQSRKSFQPKSKARWGDDISNKDAVKTDLSTGWDSAQDTKSFKPRYEVKWE